MKHLRVQAKNKEQGTICLWHCNYIRKTSIFKYIYMCVCICVYIYVYIKYIGVKWHEGWDLL